MNNNLEISEADNIDLTDILDSFRRATLQGTDHEGPLDGSYRDMVAAKRDLSLWADGKVKTALELHAAHCPLSER